MTAGLYDFHCVKSQPLNVTITIKNPDNDLANLRIYDSRMQVRRLMSSPDYLIELSSDNGRLIHDAENGKIYVSLTAEETAAIADNGIYDLELVNRANGAVIRLIQGNFYLTE